jgi:hypothetical protein
MELTTIATQGAWFYTDANRIKRVSYTALQLFLLVKKYPGRTH